MLEKSAYVVFLLAFVMTLDLITFGFGMYIHYMTTLLWLLGCFLLLLKVLLERLKTIKSDPYTNIKK